jgi:hypothetical protein
VPQGTPDQAFLDRGILGAKKNHAKLLGSIDAAICRNAGLLRVANLDAARQSQGLSFAGLVNMLP